MWPQSGSEPLVFVNSDRSQTRTVVDGDITTHCDADLAGDKDTLKSTTGFCIMLYGGAICWMAKLQATVALSTSEAETNAAVEVVKQIMHLRLLLREIGLPQEFPTVVHEDNNAAISFTQNTGNSKKTKHYQIKVHFLCEQVEFGVFEMKKVSTSEQVADTFTKALPRDQFYLFRNWLGVIERCDLEGEEDPRKETHDKPEESKNSRKDTGGLERV